MKRTRNGAFYHTLQQLFSNPDLTSTGWIFYNDDYPNDMSPYDNDPRVKKLLDEHKETKEKKKQEKKDLAKLLKPVVKDIQLELITEWEKKNGNSDWPPNVEPKLDSPSASTGKSSWGKPSSHGTNGHGKGILAFDLKTDTAFWLSHSTPRVPALHTPEKERFFYPSYAYKYAQTFICITLRNVKTACKIAKYLSLQQEPQIFGCHIPSDISDADKILKEYRIKKVDQWKFQRKNKFWLWKLARGSVPHTYEDDDAYSWWPSDAEFRSKNGKAFRMIAKSGAWYGNMWTDLIGTHLGVDLRVESWRRLSATNRIPVDDINDDGIAGVKIIKKNKKKVVETDADDYGDKDRVDKKTHHHESKDTDAQHVVDEVVNIDLENLTDHTGAKLGKGYIWHYSKDHAKWAVSVDEAARGDDTLDDRKGLANDWICVADMNRMASQVRRGGSAICFHERQLWQSLDGIERVGKEGTQSGDI